MKPRFVTADVSAGVAVAPITAACGDAGNRSTSQASYAEAPALVPMGGRGERFGRRMHG